MTFLLKTVSESCLMSLSNQNRHLQRQQNYCLQVTSQRSSTRNNLRIIQCCSVMLTCSLHLARYMEIRVSQARELLFKKMMIVTSIQTIPQTRRMMDLLHPTRPKLQMSKMRLRMTHNMKCVLVSYQTSCAPSQVYSILLQITRQQRTFQALPQSLLQQDLQYLLLKWVFRLQQPVMKVFSRSRRLMVSLGEERQLLLQQIIRRITVLLYPLINRTQIIIK